MRDSNIEFISHMNGKNHQRVKNVTNPLQSLHFKPKKPDEVDKENWSDCVPSTSSATKVVVVELKKQAMIKSIRCIDTLGAENQYDARILQVWPKPELVIYSHVSRQWHCTKFQNE